MLLRASGGSARLTGTGSKEENHMTLGRVLTSLALAGVLLRAVNPMEVVP